MGPSGREVSVSKDYFSGRSPFTTNWSMLNCALLQLDFSSLVTSWGTSLPWTGAAHGPTALPDFGTLFLMRVGGTEM